MFATTFFAIFVVPISRNPIVKPFLVLENGQIRDQLINSGVIYCSTYLKLCFFQKLIG